MGIGFYLLHGNTASEPQLSIPCMYSNCSFVNPSLMPCIICVCHLVVVSHCVNLNNYFACIHVVTWGALYREACPYLYCLELFFF